jgi:hypothetical protein
MPEPRTTPKEHDVPVFQPGKPTPDDPRKDSPMKDPPVNPEHDDGERQPRVGQTDSPKELGGIEAPDPSPDRVLYDENRAPG